MWGAPFLDTFGIPRSQHIVSRAGLAVNLAIILSENSSMVNFNLSAMH